MGTPLCEGPDGTVPQGTGEQETLQVTPLLVGSLLTVATTGWAPFASTFRLEDKTDTMTPRT